VEEVAQSTMRNRVGQTSEIWWARKQKTKQKKERMESEKRKMARKSSVECH
jgi:hypothetical protein